VSLHKIGTAVIAGARRPVYLGTPAGRTNAGGWVLLGGDFRPVQLTAVRALPSWRRAERSEAECEALLLAVYAPEGECS
jgi:hypothetical protein